MGALSSDTSHLNCVFVCQCGPVSSAKYMRSNPDFIHDKHPKGGGADKLMTASAAPTM